VSFVDALFAVTDVSYRYLDRFPAVDGASFNIRRGEFVALLGANGCGKSTLLKLLDGLVRPEAGAIHAFGEVLDAAALADDQFSRGFRARVGFVFQGSDAQLFSPTVRDEVAFGPLQLGFDEAEVEQRVDDILALLDIGHLADRAPYHLSGGEKKRVAIGSVLVTNPDVLLLDEPTSALDPRSRSWVVSLMRELHSTGKTIVCATHDLDLARQLADRAIVLGEDHRVAATGTAHSVLADTALLRRVNLLGAEEVTA
jgi:cobalt/nickel transport system ATP-binding protein